MLKQETIEAFRSHFSPQERPAVQKISKTKDQLNIAALMSCPRLGWTDTFGCVQQIFQPLGIHVVKQTGVFWGQGLTELLEGAIAVGMDYVITVDYDTIFTKEDVCRLILTMEENPDIDCLVPVQVRRECNWAMFTMRDEAGQFKKDVDLTEFQKPLTQIVSGHFGLTAIRMSSLAKLPKPWFQALPSVTGEWRNDDGHIDEDIYFWLNAEENGWKVCLANEVRIGHIQTMISWPAADFSPKFQYMSDFNRNGKPKT